MSPGVPVSIVKVCLKQLKKETGAEEGTLGRVGNIASEITSQQDRVPACNWLSQGLSVSQEKAQKLSPDPELRAWFARWSKPSLLSLVSSPAHLCHSELHVSSSRTGLRHPHPISLKPPLCSQKPSPGLHICINSPLLFLGPQLGHKVRGFIGII